MLRLAWSNGYKAHSFFAECFGRERQIWTRDIDHQAPSWLIDGLVARTGVPRQRVEGMALRAYESVVFERFNERGATRFLLPLGVYHRTRRGHGQQFCPRCLADDAEPYLRRAWRLAFNVACTRHGVFLADRCHGCGCPVVPHRSNISERCGFPRTRTVRRCFSCGQDLASHWNDAPPDVLALQISHERILDTGYAMVGSEGPIYSHLYFDGMRLLMAGARRLDKLVGKHHHFEREGVAQRADALRKACALLRDWPQELLKACSRSPAAYTAFTRDVVTPYWVAAVLRRHVRFTRAPLSKEEASAIVDAAARIDVTAAGAIARKLSGRDVSRWARRSGVSDEVAGMLIASLDHEIATASAEDRAALLRDKVMFIAARCMRLTVARLLSLRTADLENEEGYAFSFWSGVTTPGQAQAMLRWYAYTVHWRLGSKVGSALFTTRTGRSMHKSMVGARFARAVHAAALDRSIQGWAAWTRAAASEERGVASKVGAF